MTKLILIGTSGFSYPHWKEVFYPRDVAQSKWLEYYSQHFATVELNVTFYRLPSKECFNNWYKRTPKKFKYTIKGSRYITHIKKMKDCKDELQLLFKTASPLAEKLRCCLWQLPPSFKVDLDRLKSFIKLISQYKNIKHAFEFRHVSWYTQEVLKTLQQNGMTFSLTDWINSEIAIENALPFYYLRFHGPTKDRYQGRYPKAALINIANRITDWARQRLPVYAYFNNDAEGNAVINAKELINLISTQLSSNA